ncbi:hypothetical protein GCK72_026077 [Caenorhabditis remanei]|uniref:Uncharacterized protein n=1 Tax=Caenorhabditis remanei TaxID=31234 RepID=A0A6A5G540_CAERE|nr:hypothetical protein GCK72_026077 [Caenorhabditis remanei]KAF1749609.1 hypothetical protein GCK72_026077 [Caenorhabditis remanei]
MFAIPKNPTPKPLLTKQTVKEIEGKMRCLRSLMTNKRAQPPAHMNHLIDLMCFFQAMLQCKNMPATDENKEKFKHGQKACDRMIEVAIRVVPGGETLEEAWKAVNEAAKEFKSINKI